MFYTKDVEISNSDIFNSYNETIPAGAKLMLEEGTCARLVTNEKYIIHWYNKINIDELVCTKTFIGNSIINTSYPVYIINNQTTKNLNVDIYDLNDVIEFYKEIL